MMPEATPQQRRHHVTRSLLFAAGGLFLTAAALAVVQPSTPPEPIFQARQTLDLPPQHVAGDQKAAPYIASTRIRRGDTVSDLLNRLGVHEDGLLAFLTHDERARSIYKLYPGRTVQAALDEQGRMVWLRYTHTPGTTEKSGLVSAWLEVRPADGGFSAQERTTAAIRETRIAEGEITSSLFGAADQAQIPDAITMEMVDILGSRIDFLKDLRKGDRFRIVYDAYMHDGEEVGTGHIRALEFINRGKTYSAVWFQKGQESGGYYDFSGASLKGAFLRTAIKFTRISSRFGMRMHPIHKHWTGHKGVDYAAPSGTPIHATADGTVEFIGRQNGYGNVIILKNFGKYSTLYAHQSRFAKGLKKGDRVQQGQLIGYVGSTGWATGPHLHYEFRIDNRPVDPLAVDLPVARTLEPADRKAFQDVVALYRPQIELMARLQDSRIQIAQQ
ncbi:peptidoglycan DD-metalloendopeptidase family protein [Castellaniella daejeonensis]|jgi:murein DD-endopeptidase MepM/ murein hydrolase activator NlpD|uniref:Peptidoglycan DD-metalloendopeptidase family protein n=1 Tax=Castellaniella daejeonensis TaxID=659013 RepID=A0ABN0TLA7_9BURK